MTATIRGDSVRTNRREALRSLAGSGSIAAGSLWRAGTLTAVDRAVASDFVRFGSNIEPLIRLTEETARSVCVEVLAGGLKAGRSYRELLSSLFLARI